MCGIVGVLGRDDRALVRRLAGPLTHRGPDGEGTWSDAGVSFGHRRLAILDREHGAQPMESGDGRHCIIYNGECYNHPELRAALEAEGVTFRNRTDTETVLEGYRKWGPQVVERMEGMFAFAVWDTQEQILFVARDPFGVKPFFHAWIGNDWVFASEQKAFLAHPEFVAEADLDRIKERAALEFLTGQATLLRGVHQLPPGAWAHVRPGDRRIDWQPYYHVPLETFASVEEAAVAIRDRFAASVEEQLMSDVPVGVILSGGLDSAAVAAVHQRLSEVPIHTFTIAESEEVEDFRQARRLAEHLGTEHHEGFFDLDEVVARMPEFTWHNENINYTEFFFLPLFERMRQEVKVGLCGQGSDELWGGYDRYKDPLPLARQRLERLREAAPAHQGSLEAQIAFAHMSGASLAEWDQQGQLNNFQLRLVDRNSMAAGLEVRVPFLSRALHRASRAVPWGWKLGGPADTPTSHVSSAEAATRAGGAVEKWVLRKALEDIGLPPELVWRRKVPAGRATAPGVMDRFEAHAARLRPGPHPLSAALRLPAERLVHDLWQELFIHGASPRTLTLEDLA